LWDREGENLPEELLLHFLYQTISEWNFSVAKNLFSRTREF
jgi:hypothetical protein